VTTLTDERGSVLIIAVIAMLILGVLGVSFALLANIETTIGLNYKQQAQAEALAEAGLDVGRDAVRSAGAMGGTGFTSWFSAWTGGTPSVSHSAHMLTPDAGTSLAGGTFWARIDNDCPGAVSGSPAFPSSLQESAASCGAGSFNTTDTNETGIITAWAITGAGRSRVRALVIVDNPWKHVCADASPDNGGYCNDTRNTKGNPTVSPADPNDPHGPRAYTALPLPIIGCSRIDPTVHRLTTAACATFGAGAVALFSQPAITNYPAYPPLATTNQLVVMGEDPALTATAKKCNVDPGNASNYYFGYFDCALSTPCEQQANVPGCLPPTTRKACVRATDSRVVVGSGFTNLTDYASAGQPGGCGLDTGMVWKNSVTFNHNINLGTYNAPVVIYMLHDNVSPGPGNIPTLTVDTPPNPLFYGTVVTEGNTVAANKIEICTGGFAPSPLPPNPCPAYYTGAAPAPGYGYPMAYVVYDPKLAQPTISPYVPQATTTDFGTPNTHINGSIYSGGTVSFNPISVNGSVVAYNIDLQATSSTYTYVPQYGNDAPPAGFPPGASNSVVILAKSFIACNGYSDQSAGATGCQ
jgi:Tfp pilus assembly protein PilX